MADMGMEALQQDLGETKMKPRVALLGNGLQQAEAQNEHTNRLH